MSNYFSGHTRWQRIKQISRFGTDTQRMRISDGERRLAVFQRFGIAPLIEAEQTNLHDRRFALKIAENRLAAIDDSPERDPLRVTGDESNL